MAVSYFKRRKILKSLNYLDATPIRKVDFQTDDNNLVIMLVPKFRNEKLNNFLLHRRKRYFNIHLDEPGTAVWMKIDGVRNVGSICRELQEELGGKIEPAEQRITKFLTQLYEARYITFAEIENKPV